MPPSIQTPGSKLILGPRPFQQGDLTADLTLGTAAPFLPGLLEENLTLPLA